MANHKSAIKRHRQSIKRRERNHKQRAALRTAVKSVRTALQEGKLDEAKSLFKAAERALAKAAGKGRVHKKNASRRVSRLALELAKGPQAAAKA